MFVWAIHFYWNRRINKVFDNLNKERSVWHNEGYYKPQKNYQPPRGVPRGKLNPLAIAIQKAIIESKKMMMYGHCSDTAIKDLEEEIELLANEYILVTEDCR